MMGAKDWAKACGISQAAYAARRRLVAAEVRKLSKVWKGGRVNIKQLHLSKWSFCHSLFLNLQGLHKAGQVTPAQIERIDAAGRTLPLLCCLHIIGRPRVPVKESSIEGMLSILARHVSVLTLHVRAITMPLDFPNLEHLVLKVGATSHRGGGKQDDVTGNLEDFASVSMLKGLKTLYVQSNNTITQSIDLTKCLHLEHFAVRDTDLVGDLALPKGCRLHMTATKCMEISSSGTLLVSGVTELRSLSWFLSLWHRKLGPIKFKWDPVALRNLKQLRLFVDRKDLGEEWTRKGGLHLEACVWHSLTPILKVLEINAPCDLSFNMDSALPLTSLVLIAAGTLDLDLAVWEKLEAWKTTLQQISYSPAALFCRLVLKGLFRT